METTVIHEVVKELPLSLEVGASVAQESLDSMGLAVVDIGALVTEAKEHASFEENDGVKSWLGSSFLKQSFHIC